MRAQVDAAPMLIESERKIVPQLQQLQYEQMMGQANNLQSFYSQVMTPFSKLAGQYATEMGANAMAPLGQATRSAYESALGGGVGLQNAMRTSAMEQLNAGTGLTPEMTRQSQQMSRAAMSARGLAGGNQGIAQEVLGGYNLGIMRQQQAQSFASSVLGNDMAIAGNAYNQYGAPMMQGMMQGFSPTGIAANSMGMNQSLGGSYINPESQYAANIYQNNYNGQLQAATATAQANAAKFAGVMQGLGSAAGGIWHGKGN